MIKEEALSLFSNLDNSDESIVSVRMDFHEKYEELKRSRDKKIESINRQADDSRTKLSKYAKAQIESLKGRYLLSVEGSGRYEEKRIFEICGIESFCSVDSITTAYYDSFHRHHNYSETTYKGLHVATVVLNLRGHRSTVPLTVDSLGNIISIVQQLDEDGTLKWYSFMDVTSYLLLLPPSYDSREGTNVDVSSGYPIQPHITKGGFDREYFSVGQTYEVEKS
jgi:hypothetical protein